MNPAPSRAPVVIDTDVFSAGLHGPSLIAVAYEPLSDVRPSSRFRPPPRSASALRSWRPTRLLKMETRLGNAEIVQTGPELIKAYARLRVDCHRAGHALAQARHDADRWIAATAIRLRIPLVSNDGIFANAPGLTVETLATT